MTTILQFLNLQGIERKKLYGIWAPLACAILVIVTSVFIIFPTCDLLFGKSNFREHLTLFILIVVSALLVAFGTFMYLLDVFWAVWDLNPDRGHSATEKKNRWPLIACLASNLLTFFAAGYLLIISFSAMFGSGEKVSRFESLCTKNECVNLAIFSLFVFADYFFLRLVRSMLKNDGDNVNLKQVERSMFDAFTLIDLPGLLGVLVIFILSWKFQVTLNDGFAHSFAVGALTFHLIFTQFNVAYLRTFSLAQAGAKNPPAQNQPVQVPVNTGP